MIRVFAVSPSVAKASGIRIVPAWVIEFCAMPGNIVQAVLVAVTREIATFKVIYTSPSLFH